MKIIVLIPSADSLATAGVRIRYLRLFDPLADAGVHLSVTPIDDFDAARGDCDIVIVSKCYDARALVAAAVLSKRNVKVGVDLFDDYFSERHDSRLSGYRTWLRQVLRLSDFVICSTPSMAGIAAGYRDDIPAHVLNDPALQIDRRKVAELLERKIARSRSGEALRVSWFGIGDNPFFPVGLSDVSAFGGALRELAASNLPVELTILTNRRALDANGLAMIERVPVAARVDLWSGEREAELLERTDVCFLPVNAQDFSISKSLNRAVTALASGCQVLSVGYPLYEALGEVIYREPASLISDWRRGVLRLREITLETLETKIDQFASPAREAGKLADFLRRIIRDPGTAHHGRGLLALLHGFATTPAAHAAVKAAGGLSIGTSMCTQELEFDAIVALRPGRKPSLLVATETLPKLKTGRPQRDEPALRFAGRKFFTVPSDGRNQDRDDANVARSLSTQIALYDPLIEQAIDLISSSFGAGTVLLSEESGLPLEPEI